MNTTFKLLGFVAAATALDPNMNSYCARPQRSMWSGGYCARFARWGPDPNMWQPSPDERAGPRCIHDPDDRWGETSNAEAACRRTTEEAACDWLSPCQWFIPTNPPTEEPTDLPTSPTEEPTDLPSSPPTEEPTDLPTSPPTEEPTDLPSEQPSSAPTSPPTEEPTELPSEQPSSEPTALVHQRDCINTKVGLTPGFCVQVGDLEGLFLTVIKENQALRATIDGYEARFGGLEDRVAANEGGLAATELRVAANEGGVSGLETCCAAIEEHHPFPTEEPTSKPSDEPSPTPSAKPTAKPTTNWNELDWVQSCVGNYACARQRAFMWPDLTLLIHEALECKGSFACDSAKIICQPRKDLTPRLCRLRCYGDRACLSVELEGSWEVECVGDYACHGLKGKDALVGGPPRFGGLSPEMLGSWMPKHDLLVCAEPRSCRNSRPTCPAGRTCTARCEGLQSCEGTQFQSSSPEGFGDWRVECGSVNKSPGWLARHTEDLYLEGLLNSISSRTSCFNVSIEDTFCGCDYEHPNNCHDGTILTTNDCKYGSIF